jgi:hypothetical protein
LEVNQIEGNKRLSGTWFIVTFVVFRWCRERFHLASKSQREAGRGTCSGDSLNKQPVEENRRGLGGPPLQAWRRGQIS